MLFQANPNWTANTRRSITYAVSFARRFSEENDYDVVAAALKIIAALNLKYVEVKGHTFFAQNPIIDTPLSRDAFISETLEHLRLLSQTALTRRDEDQLRQIFTSFANLTDVYSTIDYGNRYNESKHDATLAAGYLAAAVESVAPHNLPDVMMEGVRRLGQAASVIMASSPTDATTTIQKIGQFACTGAFKENYRAVTLTGFEQLSALTMQLLVSTTHDITFAAKEIQSAIDIVTKLFLSTVPNERFLLTHSSYLAPYYSLAKTGTFGEWLTELANQLSKASRDDKNAERVIDHVEQWSDELYRSAKEILLLAIEKRNQFTFDIVHWIVQVTKALTAIAQSKATDDHTSSEIERNANWLLSTLSWIPDDRDTVKFTEIYGITNQLFEVATTAENFGNAEIAERAREVLLGWSMKVGMDQPYSLELGFRALTLSTFFGNEGANTIWLKTELPKALVKASLPQDVVDRAARQLRTTAASFRRRDFPTSRTRSRNAGSR